jgi:excisionase family DNA binding protein
MTPNAPSPLRLLTVDDVAEVLRLSSRTIRRMIASGQLPVIRVGRAVRVHPSALIKLMDNNGQN